MSYGIAPCQSETLGQILGQIIGFDSTGQDWAQTNNLISLLWGPLQSCVKWFDPSTAHHGINQLQSLGPNLVQIPRCGSSRSRNVQELGRQSCGRRMVEAE
jgi:hypothetical protein